MLAVFAALEGAIPYGHLKKYRFGHAHLPGMGILPCLRKSVLAKLLLNKILLVMACVFSAYCDTMMLAGHPELHCTPGVKFSSGRLGHMWPHVNGVAMANPDKISVCRTSSHCTFMYLNNDACKYLYAVQTSFFIHTRNHTTVPTAISAHAALETHASDHELTGKMHSTTHKRCIFSHSSECVPDAHTVDNK
jgi:hypothetical protein